MIGCSLVLVACGPASLAACVPASLPASLPPVGQLSQPGFMPALGSAALLSRWRACTQPSAQPMPLAHAHLACPCPHIQPSAQHMPPEAHTRAHVTCTRTHPHNHPMCVLSCKRRVIEAPALGSAILAAVAAGLHPDIPTAVDKMVSIGRTVAPDAATHAAYQPHYERCVWCLC